MDDTDDSDADAGAAGNPGNFPALFGGMFAADARRTCTRSLPRGSRAAAAERWKAGGPGPGGKKEAADAEITPLTVTRR
jgi:hypothetical protein